MLEGLASSLEFAVTPAVMLLTTNRSWPAGTNKCKAAPASFFLQVLTHAVDLHGQLLLLVHWSILAYTGLVKILKKHHKRTGFPICAPHLENLLSQPFCSVEVGAGLVDRGQEMTLFPSACNFVPKGTRSVSWLCFGALH